MANTAPERLQPTMCCIWPEIPQADVHLRREREAGDAHVGALGHPVDALGQGTGAGQTAVDLVGQRAGQVELGLLGEPAAAGHDGLGLEQIGAALLALAGGHQAQRTGRRDPGHGLGHGAARRLGVGEGARGHRVEGHISRGLRSRSPTPPK